MNGKSVDASMLTKILTDKNPAIYTLLVACRNRACRCLLVGARKAASALSIFGAASIRRAAVAVLLIIGVAESRAAMVSPEFFGLHIHEATNGTPWPKQGFGSWRLWDAGVRWPKVQPAVTTWDFMLLDSYVSLAQANRVSLLYTLALTPRWASARPDEDAPFGPGTAAVPASIGDWKLYVETIAQRYKGKITAYEIWNEPNDRAFYTGTTQELVNLTCAAYKTIKAIDRAIIVVSPPYVGEQNIPKLEEFLALGGKECIDVVSFHFYIPIKPPEAIVPLIDKVRKAMIRQQVEDMPLWNTEAGWLIENTDGSEIKWPDNWPIIRSEQSAAYIARAFLLSSAFGIDRFYWYAWDNGAMGLIEPKTKMLKPGAVALEILAGWLTGRPIPKCERSNKIWLCTTFTENAERRLVVWSPSGSNRYVLPDGWQLETLERVDGRVEGFIKGSVSVAIDEMPRLLTIRPKVPG